MWQLCKSVFAYNSVKFVFLTRVILFLAAPHANKLSYHEEKWNSACLPNTLLKRKKITDLNFLFLAVEELLNF